MSNPKEHVDGLEATSHPSAGQEGLNFTAALTLTAAVILGAAEGATAKALGIPLAILSAFLSVRAGRHRAAPGKALRDGVFLVGLFLALALSSAVAVASLKADNADDASVGIRKPSSTPIAPGSEFTTLRDHVPSVFKRTCRRISDADHPRQTPTGTRDTAVCYPSTAAREVRYYQYFNPWQMREPFSLWQKVDVDYCRVRGKELAPEKYSTPRGSGQMYCVIDVDRVVLRWTVEQLQLMAEAHRAGRDADTLYDWWKAGDGWI